MIRVVIADDSALMRKILNQILASDPDIKVVAMARDGEDAVLKAREFRPDVLTMDINMPREDGITALQHIVNENLCPVVMVSSLSQEGAVITFEALELGAFDYVAKPGGTVSSNMRQVSEELIGKVKAAATYRHGKSAYEQKRRPASRRQATSSRSKTTPSQSHVMPCKAVVMGISTGGPKVIYEVLPLIPSDINAALFLVQHMPPNFTSAYVTRLNSTCELEVVEAEAGLKVQPGVVYVGKGGRHLTLMENGDGEAIIRLPNRPDHLFIPSVSVMMKSVLSIYGIRTVGVIMTGMGSDGADAMVDIRNAGGKTIAESEDSAIVFGMPAEAIRLGGAERVVPIWNIAKEIVKAVNC